MSGKMKESDLNQSCMEGGIDPARISRQVSSLFCTKNAIVAQNIRQSFIKRFKEIINYYTSEMYDMERVRETIRTNCKQESDKGRKKEER